MRMLVPLDGSELAERALAPAAQLMRRAGEGTLFLVRVVVNPSVAASDESGYSPTAAQSILGLESSVDQDYLTSVASRPELAELRVKTIVVMGLPAAAICAQARQHQIDLIVLTSHGRSGLAHLALGSVAEAVARDSRVPTLIVRAEGETLPDIGRFVPPTLLVPLDGTALSEAAIEPAQTIAHLLHGTIRLLRVLPQRSFDPAKDQVLADLAHKYLTAVHDRLQEAGVNTHRELAWGEPAHEIVQESQRHHVDIVVLATHAYTGMDRLAHGSVAEAVLRQTRLPVLIVSARAAVANT